MSKVEPNYRTTVSTINTTKLYIQQEIHLKKNTIIIYRHSQIKKATELLDYIWSTKRIYII